MAHDFKLNEETGIQNRPKKPAGGIIGMLIKAGVVKTEGQANALMLLIVLIGIAGIIYINLRTFGG
jgi:hypothetical protein